MSNSQQNKINALLAIVVILLSALYYFQNFNITTPINQTINAPLTAQQATQIKIYIANKNFSLVKQQLKQWVFVDPLPITALNKRVDKLLEILNYPYSQSFLVKDINLQELGLKPAKARLTINNEIFEFGDMSPLSGERYVLYKNRVYLTQDLIVPLMDSRLQGLADMSLLPQGVDVLGIKTPFFESTTKSDLAPWQVLKAIGIKKWKNEPSLGEIVIRTQKKTYHFSIIQKQPLLILKPKKQPVLYLLSNNIINN